MFDLVVVPVTFIAQYNPDLPAVGVLRLLRVLRVLKLFQRLSSLRVIINALLKSILPVANAFVVLFLVTAIYAVVATMFFYKYDNVQFGKFSASLYTMFQVCTGDGWSTDVVRPMFQFRTKQYGLACLPAKINDNTLIMPIANLSASLNSSECIEFLGSRPDGPWAPVEWLSIVFFVSYIIVAGYFLLNIVVAVLLDEFVNSVTEEREEMAKAKDSGSRVFAVNHLDPLMLSFSTFQSHTDLRKRFQSIFRLLDSDSAGFLSYRKWQEGSALLDYHPPIVFSPEDWNNLIKSENSKGDPKKVAYEEFEAIMHSQLLAFTLRQSAHKMLTLPNTDSNYHHLMMSRQILTTIRNTNVSLKSGGIHVRGQADHDDEASIMSGDTGSVKRGQLSEYSSSARPKSASFNPLGPSMGNADIDYDLIAFKTAAMVEERLDLARFSESLERVSMLDARMEELDGKMNHVIQLLHRSLENTSSAPRNLHATASTASSMPKAPTWTEAFSPNPSGGLGYVQNGLDQDNKNVFSKNDLVSGRVTAEALLSTSPNLVLPTLGGGSSAGKRNII